MLDDLHWRNNTAHRIWDAKEGKGATQQDQGLKSEGNLAHCVQFAEICYEQLCLCWGRCVHKIVRDYVHFVGCMFGGRCWCAIGGRIIMELYNNVQIHVFQLVNGWHKEGSNERQMSLECTESNESKGMKMKWQVLDAICAYLDRCKITGTAVQHWDHRICYFSE